MTVLAAPINDTTRTIRVDAAIANPSYPLFRTLDAETIKITGGATTVSWQVERGVGDTRAVAHIAGTTLATDASPFGASEGGATPTLAEVLAEGNDPDGTEIRGATGAGGVGGSLTIAGAGNDDGGIASLNGGDGAAGESGGQAIVNGGAGDGGASNGAYLVVYGGNGNGAHGLLEAYTNDVAGSSGDVLASNGAERVVWTGIYSQAASAPGVTLTTLLYGDTTAVTGGLYVWSGSAYRKLTGVLP